MEGRDLVVASCAPAIADSVAEMTVGELIFGLRRLIEKNRKQMGREDLPDPDKVNLFRSTIGVIGASQVGHRVIKLLRAFEAEILLYDPFVEQEEAERLGATRVTDLVELFRRSNAVTLHTPALPETRHLVGAEHFAALRDHGVFVNTSRGTCVDEPAMVEALRSRPLFAFLDVTDPRFSGPDTPLRQLPNCFMTPHIAGGPNQRMGEQTVSDIRAFLNGDSPLMAVTASQLARLA
jgi:phosphoglycerate dehydrogenase-like enzyme